MNIPRIDEIEKLMFFKIETVSAFSSFEELLNTNSIIANEWKNKTDYFLSPQEESNFEFLTEEEKNTIVSNYYFEKANFYPEFGKVLTITFGMYKGSSFESKIISYSGEEKEILTKAQKLFDSDKANYILAGKGIKDYDIRYLCIRYLQNDMAIPKRFLDIIKAKPWETSLYDLDESLKFGSYRPYKIRLNMLNNIFNSYDVDTQLDYMKTNSIYYSNDLVDDNVTTIEKNSQSSLQIIMDSFLKLAKLHS